MTQSAEASASQVAAPSLVSQFPMATVKKTFVFSSFSRGNPRDFQRLKNFPKNGCSRTHWQGK